MTPPACMILAAGFGTRMGPLTQTRPKPLIPVAGRPLIDHALGQARGAGVGRIVVNGHHHADQMRAHLRGMADVAFSEEQPVILDSAGGIRHALPLLAADTIFTLNADAVWSGPNALATLAAAWDPERMDVLALMVPQSRAVGRQGGGDFARDADGRLGWDKAGEVYTGAQILKAGLLDGYPEGPFSLHDVWRAAMAQGRMFGTPYKGYWADVGHPDGIALAEEMVTDV
ncbi:nucleotidyltransferase family protein [Nioella sp. MMSF_3534]|uniref:nucleotidyltransferase family protein n=1 Tax=Nioella sp. MMSF_3534 TaxID=3046720 RepID=UPI00273D6A53|nr:nucleotidyltransferase family protein [Nioella sp. MMSF_3534]